MLNPEALEEVLSSGVRLKIESALSVRPRTLGELASITGISVQGVLKHLKRLGELGVVEEQRLQAKRLKARTVYAATGQLVGDYSSGDLVVVRPTERLPPRAPRATTPDLEGIAAEILLLQRRVRDHARRLGRTIDELVDEREALLAGMGAIDLTPEERIVAEVVLTEETLEQGLRVLSKYYGIEDRRSIDEALAKVRRSGGK